MYQEDSGKNIIKEELEDIKGVIRIRKSKKNRQYNGQKKKVKQRSTKHTHMVYLKQRMYFVITVWFWLLIGLGLLITIIVITCACVYCTKRHRYV